MVFHRFTRGRLFSRLSLGVVSRVLAAPWRANDEPTPRPLSRVAADVSRLCPCGSPRSVGRRRPPGEQTTNRRRGCRRRLSIVSGAARGRRSIAYSAAARRALGAAFAGKWGLATLRHKSSRRKSSLSRRAGGRLSRVRRVAHRWLREFSAATTTRTRADAFAAYRRTDI